MKKVVTGGVLLLFAALFFAFSASAPRGVAPVATTGADIHWYSWEEAMALMENQPKKVFIDVYTDWCGWCKRMDATTFKDPAVVKYLNDHFYPVKFDAEQKGDIEYNGYTLQYRPAGRRGVHELAYSLLDGRLGYPAYVYLNEKQERIKISPGYKPAKDLLRELKYINDEHYKNMSFEEFAGR